MAMLIIIMNINLQIFNVHMYTKKLSNKQSVNLYLARHGLYADREGIIVNILREQVNGRRELRERETRTNVMNKIR